jgi:ClpP class serine protease
MEEVDAVGRGRVWTGTQAKERRLVDELGGLAEAIAEAKQRAGIAEDDLVQLVALPALDQSLLSQLLRLGGGGEAGAAGAGLLETLLRFVPPSLLADPGAPQARLPYEIVLEE